MTFPIWLPTLETYLWGVLIKNLIFVSLCVLIISSLQYSQAQLLKVGNAVQYSNEGNWEWIILSTKKVTINGKEYFERKNYQPLLNQNAFKNSYERIEGDSVHYVLTTDNQDSLLFNFNWSIGKKFIVGSEGSTIHGQRIDSIRIINTFFNDDTVYVLKNFLYNIAASDTDFNVIPEFNHLSQKIGRLDEGLWIYTTGVKVNGARYGQVYPYPEEITFSADSLYSEFAGDTVNCFIRNTSDYDVVLDSIFTSNFYGYLMYLIKDNDYFFINLFNQYPNHPLDTLNYTIPAHDSIQLQIYNVDLCPVCDYEVQNYFIDTLQFVFSFNGTVNESFSKFIQISGEGRRLNVEEEGVLPNKFVLSQNHPNPFNPSTSIQYAIGSRQFVLLKVYDLLGREVATLVNEEKPAGSYELEFNPESSIKNPASGVYFYRLQAGSFVETKKMILLRWTFGK